MSTSNNCRVTLRGQGSGNRQEPSNTSRLSQVGPAGPFATAFGSPSGTHPPTDLYDQFPNLPNQPRVPNGPNLSTLANLPNLPNLPTLPNLPQQNSFSHDVVFLLSSHSSKALEAARSKKQDQPGRPAHASQCQCTNTGCRRGNRRTSQVGALCPFATPCGCPFCRTCIRRPRCLHLAKIQRHRVCDKRMPSLCCSLCRARPLRPALKLAGKPAGSTR